MSSFSYADFKIFARATNINDDMYATIAKGVIAYVRNQYRLYLTSEDIEWTTFLASGTVSYTPIVAPINAIIAVWYDYDLVDFTYYGDDVELTTTLTDYRKPIKLTMDVGYADGELPDDLRLAVYRHIIAVYQAIDKHTDNISKVNNTDGNTTFYISDAIPIAVKMTYEFYASSPISF